jgi:hypothetical protein
MRTQFSYGHLRWLVIAGTIAASAAVMAVMAPGGAAQTAEKEYSAHFEAECVLGPGFFNEKGTIKVTTRGTAPEQVSPGEEFAVKNSTITVVTPKAWGESLYALGVREARGLVTSTVLDSSGAEPATINAAKPPEFPEGLPFSTPVEQKEVEFTVPSEGRTFVLGPFKVTGSPGEAAKLTIDTAPGFRQTVEGYESTGEGIQSETSGYGEHGEHDIGPVKVSCTAPPGVVEGEIPIANETTSSATSSSSTTTSTTTSSSDTTTTTTTTAAGTAPVIQRVEPASGPVAGETPVRIVGLHLSPAEERCAAPNISACKISVHFGTREATVLADSPTNIAVLSPRAEGPGTVAVTVTVAGTTNSPATDGHFTYKNELEELEERLREKESSLPSPSLPPAPTLPSP